MKPGIAIFACGLILGWCGNSTAQEKPTLLPTIGLKNLKSADLLPPIRAFIATPEGKAAIEPIANLLAGPLETKPIVLVIDDGIAASVIWKCLKPGLTPADIQKAQAVLRPFLSDALLRSGLLSLADDARSVGSKVVPVSFDGPPVELAPKPPTTDTPGLPVFESYRMPQEPTPIGISGWTYPPYYGFTPFYVGGFYPSYNYGFYGYPWWYSAYGAYPYYGYYGYGLYPFYTAAPGYFAPVFAPRWYGGYVFPPVVRAASESADLAGDADTLYGRGRRRYLDGRPTEAVAILKAAIRKNADDARMWYFLALSEKSLGLTDDATESARRGQAVEVVNGRDDRVVGSLEAIQGETRVFLRTQREARMTREEARAIVARPLDATAVRVVGAK